MKKENDSESRVGMQVRIKEVVNCQENIVTFDAKKEYENMKDLLVAKCVDLYGQLNPFDIELKELSGVPAEKECSMKQEYDFLNQKKTILIL